MSIEMDEKEIFMVESFIRKFGNVQAILDMDEIILKSDITTESKINQVHTLVERNVKRITESKE